MFVCLKTRQGTIHIINWISYRGLYHTLCGKAYSYKSNVETFSSDNTFRGMCSGCYEIQEKDNMISISYDIRNMRNDYVFEQAMDLHKAIERGWGDVSQIFDSLNDRSWTKQKRMRRKFPSEDNKINKRHRYKLQHDQSKR